MLTRRATAVVGTLIAVLLLAYVIWHPAEEQDGKAASSPASPQAFSTAQQQNFAVLRGSTQPVPLPLQAELRQARNQTVRSLRLDTAKYVQAGDGIWVTNGRNATCIVQAHGGAVSCVTRGIFLRRGVALGVAELGPMVDPKDREFAVYGIVPNQIRAIEVRIGDKKRRVQIRNNSYSLRASEPILIKRFER
jgi:hypothetical protein